MYPLQPTVRVERAPARVRVEVEGQARAWAWTQARRQRLLFCGHNSANGSGAYAASSLLLVHAWKLARRECDAGIFARTQRLWVAENLCTTHSMPITPTM